MTIKVLPRDSHTPAQSLARGLGVFVFVTSLLVVFFAGTFPFDFAAPEGDAWLQIRNTFDRRWIQDDPRFIDRGQNLLFLMPFGFGVAAVVRPARRRVLLQLMVATLSSAALSTTVEVLQTFVSFRDPSLVDIWCNTVGGLVGTIIYVLIGDRVLLLLARVLLKLKPMARPWALTTLLVIYAGLHLAAPYLMHNPGDLSVWNLNMPLLVGNELSGDRGWNGAVWEVALADRAADDDEIMSLCRGAPPRGIFAEHLLGHYRLRGDAPYSDQAIMLPDLQWVARPLLINDQCVLISPNEWLRSMSPATKANYRIGETCQFTLTATAASFIGDPHSERRPPNPAPWRIVSISDSVSRQNVLIGQEEADLAVRVRTALRSTPTLYIQNVFANSDAHHLAVVQRGSVTIIYIDGVERGRCEITPEAKLIWRLYPRGGVRLRLERYGFRSYAAIYRLLVFIPFAALLGATLVTSRISRRNRRIVAVGAIALFALALEIVLGTEAASGFQIKNLCISLVVGLGTIGMLALVRRRRQTLS
jgi:glycopeptide antibiotics resistance protein